jgi:hypothetical protein
MWSEALAMETCIHKSRFRAFSCPENEVTNALKPVLIV